MGKTLRPLDINPREDRYDGALPAYGVTFLRERRFRMRHDGVVHVHHDQMQMLVMCDGQLTLRLGTVRLHLTAGDALVVPMNHAHCLIAAGSTDPLTLIDLRTVAGAQHDLSRLLAALPMSRPLKLHPVGWAKAAAALAAATATRDWRRTPRILASIWQLVGCLKLRETEMPVVGDQELTDYRLRRAEAFIMQNIAEEIGVEDIAAAAGLSRSQLTRLYREELGVGPAERLRNARINVARRLLASGRMSVKEVARAVGFRWVHHFTRTYRTVRGHPPSLDLGVDD